MQPTIVREMQDSEGRVIPVWFDPKRFLQSMKFMKEIKDKNGSARNVWVNPADPAKPLPAPPEGSYQISPFTPNLKWDITKRP